MGIVIVNVITTYSMNYGILFVNTSSAFATENLKYLIHVRNLTHYIG